MGTAAPPGKVKVVAPAVRFTCCWAGDTPVPRKRADATSTAVFKVVLRFLIRISALLLIGFVNRKFPGIDNHHHQHSSRENVIGGNLALVVGVPHKRKSCFARWTVGDRAGGRSCSDRSGCPNSGIRSEIRTASVPRAIGQDVRIGQSRRPASPYISEWRNLQRLVVVLAPLEVVDRCWSASVIAVCVRCAGELRACIG